MNPIVISRATLAAAVSLFYELKAAVRSENPLLHHALIERGAGRVVLAATDLTTAHVLCHLPRPLPLTKIQQMLAEPRWAAEAMRFLVPLADLRQTSRSAVHGPVAIMPSEILIGPVTVANFPAPPVTAYPAILPPLTTIEAGTHRIKLGTGRIDVAALANW